MKRNFAVVCDIDGVVYKSKELIPKSDEAIKLLLENNVPVQFVTNDGGLTEKLKSEHMSKILGLPISQDQIILSHTPFKDLGKKYYHKRVLCMGVYRERTLDVMKSYGFTNAVYLDDYLKDHPYLVSFYHPLNKEYVSTKKEYNVPINEILKEEPFSAIFVLHEPINWYEGLQVISDILTTNGQVGKDIENKEETDFRVPVFISNPDLEFSGKFLTPRFTAGAFAICIKELFKSRVGKELKDECLIQSGKPLKYSFEYVQNKFCSEGVKTFYLIGDNPKSDIKGANSMGWNSILVKTGCFPKEKENDEENPAKFVKNNLYESVKFILERENQIN